MNVLSRKASPGIVKADWAFMIVLLLAMVALTAWMFLDPASFQSSNFVRFMQDNNLRYLAPETIILIVIIGAVLHLSFAKTQAERSDTWALAVLGTAFAFVSLVVHYFCWYRGVTSPDVNRLVFYSALSPSGMFNADLFSLVIRMLLTGGTFLTLLFTRRFIDTHADVPGEFYVLLLSALLGGMMLAGASDLIMIFVALETLSISSYILVGYLRGNVSSAEAGLKYLLYGGVATAILLFGFSILYGITGSTALGSIASSLNGLTGQIDPMILAIMTVMIVGGVCFKLSAAPFHMWAPDAYEGAPTPVVAFLSVVSKIAAFALAIRLFTGVLGGMPGWTGLIATISVVSMLIGNVVALTQRNIKRLLAYSTVAHVGYMLLGLLIVGPNNAMGLASLLYYLMAYLFMNIGGFAVVTWFENITGSTEIAAYGGLVRKQPAIALIFSVMLLSLAGIPITAGFFGKFFLFQAVATAGTGYLWLVVVALLTSTISLYYYLNVVRLMVIADPSPEVANMPDVVPQRGFWDMTPVAIAMLLCLYGTLALGFLAQPAINLSLDAVKGIHADLASQPVTHPVLTAIRR